MRARRITPIVVALCLLSIRAESKSLALWHDWSVAAFGGLKNANVWHVGAQLFTARGPGDSGWIMTHHGFGLDLSYAQLGDDSGHLRPLVLGEFMLFWFFAQAGVGANVKMKEPSESGFNVMAAIGLRIYFRDEYQGPSISVGGRFDWIAGDREVVPSFNARLGLPFEVD